MLNSEILRYKSKIKNYLITEESIIVRLKKYKKNLELSLYEKKFIDIKDLRFTDNDIKVKYSSIGYLDKEEIFQFLINGGMQFAFPVNNNNEVLANVDKILILKEAMENGKISSLKVLCYIVEDYNNIKKSKNTFDIIIPKHYYEILFFKDFYLNLLSKKQITEQIKTSSDEFNFKDQFIKINENRYEVLESYPFLTDEYLFALYKKGKLNTKKFPIKDILKK
jgi:hypothetical protein